MDEEEIHAAMVWAQERGFPMGTNVLAAYRADLRLQEEAKLRGVGPDEGHQFHFEVRVQGSSAVVGRPLQDEDQLSPALRLTVRAWDLREALEKAAALPLASWFHHDMDPPDLPTPDEGRDPRDL